MGARIRQHHGDYYVFINHRGQRKAVRCRTEREAIKTAANVREALLRGEIALPGSTPDAAVTTLRAYVETWRRDTASSSLKSSTLRGYDANLDQHILPALGDRLLSDIDRGAVKALVAACRTKGLARLSRCDHGRCYPDRLCTVLVAVLGHR